VVRLGGPANTHRGRLRRRTGRRVGGRTGEHASDLIQLGPAVERYHQRATALHATRAVRVRTAYRREATPRALDDQRGGRADRAAGTIGGAGAGGLHAGVLGLSAHRQLHADESRGAGAAGAFTLVGRERAGRPHRLLGNVTDRELRGQPEAGLPVLTAAGRVAGRRQRGAGDARGYFEDARRPALARVSSGARAPAAPARHTATSLTGASSGARAPAASAGASSGAPAPAAPACHTATPSAGARSGACAPTAPAAAARHTATTVRGGVGARGRPRARSLRDAGGHHEHE